MAAENGKAKVRNRKIILAVFAVIAWSAAHAFTVSFVPPTAINGYISAANWTFVNFTTDANQSAVSAWGVDWNGTNVSAQGLAAFWKFSEAAGTTAAEISNQSLPVHLGGLRPDNATKAPSFSPGKFGNGLSFDGSNDLAQVASGDALVPAGNFTLSAWIKPSRRISPGNLSSSQEIISGNSYDFAIDSASGSLRFFIKNQSFSNSSAFSQNISSSTCSGGSAALLSGPAYSIDAFGPGFAAFIAQDASCPATHQIWLLSRTNGSWHMASNISLSGITGLSSSQVFNNTLYYALPNASSNAGLLSFNATNVTNVTDAALSPCGGGIDLAASGTSLYYLCNETSTGNGLLYSYNSTWALQANLSPADGNLADLVIFNGTLHALQSNATSRRLLAFNGTGFGLAAELSGQGGSSAHSAMEYNQSLFLAASATSGERSVWNGTQAANISRGAGVFNGTGYALAPSAALGGELVSAFANGTGAGSALGVFNGSSWNAIYSSPLNTSGGLNPKSLFFFNGTLYYAAASPYGTGTISQLVALPGYGAEALSIRASWEAAWYHVAAVFDNATVKLYVNGSLEANVSAPNLVGLGGAGLLPFTIGASASHDRFAGVIDEAKVYSRALTRGEVMLDYETELGKYYANVTNQSGNFTYFAWASNGTTLNSTGSRNITLEGIPDLDLPTNITFVAPSNPPESYNYSNFTFINLTVNDTSSPIGGCLLEWQGTNETMNLGAAGQLAAFCYINKTIAASGNYSYRVWANDTQGNYNASTGTRYALLDNGILNVTIASPLNSSHSATTLQLNFTAGGMNISACHYSLDGGANVTLPSCANATIPSSGNLSEGQHNVMVRANTTQGNDYSSTAYFFIDRTPPALVLASPAQGGNYSSAGVSLNFTATDNYALQSCWYSLNGGANTSISSCQNASFTGQQESNTIAVFANDSAGNVNSSPASFTVDSTPPSVAISSPANSTYSTSAVSLNYNANDTRLDECYYKVNGGTDNMLAGCANTSLSFSNGQANLTVYANDTFNNTSAATAVFTISFSGGGSGGGGGGGGGYYYDAASAAGANGTAGPSATPNPLLGNLTALNFTNITAGKNATLSVDNERLSVSVKPGELAKLELGAFNRLNVTSNFTVNISDEIRDLVSLAENASRIGANSGLQLGIVVSVPKGKAAGKYQGIVTLSDGRTVIEVPITVTVEQESESLLEVHVAPLAKKVQPGGELRVKIELFNLGVPQKAVGLRLLLIEESSDRVITALVEDIEVRTSLTAIKTMLVPDDARPGRYMVKAVASSGQGAERKLESSDISYVTVEQNLGQGWLKGYNLLILTLLAVATVAGVIAYRKFDLEKRIRFLKNVDFEALPGADSGSAFIGRIAETSRDAFMGLDKLCTHVLFAGTTGSGKTVGCQVIVEEALRKGVSVVVLDPTGQWSGFLRPQKNDAMLKNYARFGMKKSDAQPFPGRVRVVTDSKEKFNLRECLAPGEISILVLNELSKSSHDAIISVELEEFVSKVLESVFESNLEESGRLRVLIVCDEVHRLLPKFGASGRAFNEIERGVREFRKWGVGVMLVSQVTADFMGEIKANIGTEIQFRSKNESDLERLNLKYGPDYVSAVMRAKVGAGLVQNPDYNKGRPYFVAFRPLLHNLARLSDAELRTIREFDAKLDALAQKIGDFRNGGADTSDADVELELARTKNQLGHFDVVKVYAESLEQKVRELEKKYG